VGFSSNGDGIRWAKIGVFAKNLCKKNEKKHQKNTKTGQFGKIIPIGGPKSKFCKKKEGEKPQKLVIFRLF
jgi:hypothetical protein